MSETNQTVNQADQVQVGLTLQDLILVSQIIQLTSSRGAFHAEELQAVGTLYNKLMAFLQQTGAIKSATPEQTAPENSQESVNA